MIYKSKHILEEAPDTGDRYRRAYAEDIDAYISRLNTEDKKKKSKHTIPLLIVPTTFSLQYGMAVIELRLKVNLLTSYLIIYNKVLK